MHAKLSYAYLIQEIGISLEFQKLSCCLSESLLCSYMEGCPAILSNKCSAVTVTELETEHS